MTHPRFGAPMQDRALEDTAGEDLVAANLHQLAAGRDLLARLVDERYVATPIRGMGSIGAHLRHCLDVYELFLSGLATGRVDYDARTRDVRIETERSHAIAVIEDVLQRLDAVATEDAARPLAISVDAAEPCWTPSSVGRELQFLHGHTVHHFALVTALLRVQGLEPGPEFGVAPSTLRHREQHRAHSSAPVGSDGD